jgi:hypothetical protein
MTVGDFPLFALHLLDALVLLLRESMSPQRRCFMFASRWESDSLSISWTIASNPCIGGFPRWQKYLPRA